MARNKARLRYDKDSDIVYIKIKDGPIEDTVDVAEDVFVERDKHGDIAGIEIWRARQLLPNPLAKHISDQLRVASKAG